RQKIAVVIRAVAWLKGTRPDEFLAEMRSTGLLVETEPGVYAFAHQTFQEYLAARHVLNTKRYSVLTEKVGDPRWREVILLATAGREADIVIRACLADGSIAALSVAFECTETGARISPSLYQELRALLAVAFQDNADRQHQRLVAGIQAVRHLRAASATSF